MEPTPITTIASAIDAARPAYDALAELGEEIEDEWSYVNDLAAAWRERFDEVAADRGDDPVPPAVAAAVDALIAEAAAIDDPHRAIDWLSTYPQVLLIAIGERP
ncbi:MAG: hypothetical protein QOF49_1566 [Chloroflexota bacterium]|nr:hypothetical protein [Chloroflexota bacterium]